MLFIAMVLYKKTADDSGLREEIKPTPIEILKFEYGDMSKLIAIFAPTVGTNLIIFLSNGSQVELRIEPLIKKAPDGNFAEL